MADKIQKAYQASKSIYDDVLTQGSFFSKMYIKIFWSGTDDIEIARKILSYIPNDFKANHGVLHRDYTLATGGSICDYWIVPDKIRNPQ